MTWSGGAAEAEQGAADAAPPARGRAGSVLAIGSLGCVSVLGLLVAAVVAAVVWFLSDAGDGADMPASPAVSAADLSGTWESPAGGTLTLFGDGRFEARLHSRAYRPTDPGYRPESFLAGSGTWSTTPGSGGVAASVVLRPAVDPTAAPTSPGGPAASPTRAPDPGSWTMYIRGTRSAPELYFYLGDPDAGVLYPFHRTGR